MSTDVKKFDRAFIQSGGVERLLDGVPDFEVVPLEERETLRKRILSEFDNDHDVWIFAYGSLMWNPAFRYAEQTLARLHGYHRAFCQQTQVTRGSSEYPGLMAALERGGSCRGVAYRIAAPDLDSETRVLWNREMPLPVYEVRVLKIATDQGSRKAITFVANRASAHYVGRLPLESQIERICRASGKLGSNADYLFRLVDRLEELGITDRRLALLRQHVAEAIAAQQDR